jgi:hypothetical protein
MAGGGSRGIHAARPTARDLRSACTQVAIGGVWAFCVGRSRAQQQQQQQQQQQHSLASSLPQVGCLISKTSACTGLFPAKSGPTRCALCQRSLIVPTLRVGMHPVTLRVTSQSRNARRLRTRSVRGGFTTRSVGTIRNCRTGFSREAFDLLKRASDLHTQEVHTSPIATWVQAERRRRGVGRAAWMPRERRCGQGCPFGAGPRSVVGVREPDEVGPNQEQALLLTFSAF